MLSVSQIYICIYIYKDTHPHTLIYMCIVSPLLILVSVHDLMIMVVCVCAVVR